MELISLPGEVVQQEQQRSLQQRKSASAQESSQVLFETSEKLRLMLGDSHLTIRNQKNEIQELRGRLTALLARAK